MMMAHDVGEDLIQRPTVDDDLTGLFVIDVKRLALGFDELRLTDGSKIRAEFRKEGRKEDLADIVQKTADEGLASHALILAQVDGKLTRCGGGGE